MNSNKHTPRVALAIAILTLSGTGCSSSPAISTTPSATISGLDATTTQAEDYRIGDSDLLDIKVFRADELSREVRVDADGNITLPLLGKVAVNGLTQSATETKLAELFVSKRLLKNPQITVFIKERTSQRITLEGEVSKPGIYPISGQVTVLQAMALGGGPSALAATDKVVLFRRDGEQSKGYLIDLGAIRGGKLADPYVRNDDRIVVHRSDSRYWLREAGTLLNPLTTLNGLVR
ncbi:MAG: polysaccharide biosynthesis/export family protein [Candidatus Thiothrix putei]|uniref:Polysaccharide biosynthesis/export family protein n=1 Tax=Candidatus Thiothrix putei TaxID=3080811 RepID=A0AA95KRY7_9GAMM|nr:MAG: polysaccharide biosynthesis/export family protein [Candidatus Thiothrix putei]